MTGSVHASHAFAALKARTHNIRHGSAPQAPYSGAHVDKADVVGSPVTSSYSSETAGPRRARKSGLPVRPKTVVGPYTVADSVGRGCFGEVFRAWDAAGGPPVALKMSRADDAEAAQCDARELHALRSLHHPHIVGLQRHLQSSIEGVTYSVLVMDYCGGGTLKARILSRQLSIPQVFQVIQALASALDYVHSRGLLHGDLKPSNVLFGANGPMLSDFGNSRPLIAAPGTTMEGGDRWYLPPEAGQPGSLAPSYDMWSLGVIVADMATLTVVSSAYSEFCPLSWHPAGVERLRRDASHARGGTFWPLVQHLVCLNPTDRATAAAVVECIAAVDGPPAVPGEVHRWQASLLKMLFVH